MTIAATVLYEDSMQSGPGGSYPLHDLVLRMLEDEIGGEPWRLRKLVIPNPRNGIGNLLRDLGRTSLIAGAGHLCVVVDRDAIARHLNLATNAPDTEVLGALREKSDAPERLGVYFLQPNLEGLLRGIRDCDPSLLPGLVQAALRKKLNARDLVLNEVRKAPNRELRECLRKAQPGLDALVSRLRLIIETFSAAQS